jgi:hypothetical protein
MLCAAVPEGVTLRELRCGGDGSILCLGVARGQNRLDGLQKIRRFAVEVQALQFLADPREAVDPGLSRGGTLFFEIRARWRGDGG